MYDKIMGLGENWKDGEDLERTLWNPVSRDPAGRLRNTDTVKQYFVNVYNTHIEIRQKEC